MDAVDEEICKDILCTGGLLGKTQMTKAILFNKGSAVAQIASNNGGISEGGGRIGLIPNDDDRVLQRVVPWTGEPLDGTSCPSVAIMRGLGELAAN